MSVSVVNAEYYKYATNNQDHSRSWAPGFRKKSKDLPSILSSWEVSGNWKLEKLDPDNGLAESWRDVPSRKPYTAFPEPRVEDHARSSRQAWNSVKKEVPHNRGWDNGHFNKPNRKPTSRIEEEISGQNLYKTELCRSYEETGTCRYGLKCQFAHGKAELRPVMRHPKYKTEVCKTFHTIGTCPYGKRCRFIHKVEEQQQYRESSRPPIDFETLETRRNFNNRAPSSPNFRHPLAQSMPTFPQYPAVEHRPVHDPNSQRLQSQSLPSMHSLTSLPALAQRTPPAYGPPGFIGHPEPHVYESAHYPASYAPAIFPNYASSPFPAMHPQSLHGFPHFPAPGMPALDPTFIADRQLDPSAVPSLTNSPAERSNPFQFSQMASSLPDLGEPLEPDVARPAPPPVLQDDSPPMEGRKRSDSNKSRLKVFATICAEEKTPHAEKSAVEGSLIPRKADEDKDAMSTANPLSKTI